MRKKLIKSVRYYAELNIVVFHLDGLGWLGQLRSLDKFWCSWGGEEDLDALCLWYLIFSCNFFFFIISLFDVSMVSQCWVCWSCYVNLCYAVCKTCDVSSVVYMDGWMDGWMVVTIHAHKACSFIYMLHWRYPLANKDKDLRNILSGPRKTNFSLCTTTSHVNYHI